MLGHHVSSHGCLAVPSNGLLVPSRNPSLPSCCFPDPFIIHPIYLLVLTAGLEWPREPGPGPVLPRVVPAGAQSWQASHSWCVPVGRDAGFWWSGCSARIQRLAQKSLFSPQAEVQSLHAALCWEMEVRESRKWWFLFMIDTADCSV